MWFVTVYCQLYLQRSRLYDSIYVMCFWDIINTVNFLTFCSNDYTDVVQLFERQSSTFFCVVIAPTLAKSTCLLSRVLQSHLLPLQIFQNCCDIHHETGIRRHEQSLSGFSIVPPEHHIIRFKARQCTVDRGSFFNNAGFLLAQDIGTFLFIYCSERLLA